MSTIAPSAALPFSQWRLLNVIFHHYTWLRLGVALNRAEADANDLLELVDVQLVEAVVDGEAVSVTRLRGLLADERLTSSYNGRGQVRITEAGKDWVRTSPRNRLLFVVRALRRPALLDACGTADVKLWETPAELVEQGVVEVFNSVGELATPQSLRAAPTPHWRIRLTSKGRQLVAK